MIQRSRCKSFETCSLEAGSGSIAFVAVVSGTAAARCPEAACTAHTRVAVTILEDGRRLPLLAVVYSRVSAS